MKFNARLVFRIAFQVLVTLDLHVWDLAGSIFIKSPKKRLPKQKRTKSYLANRIATSNHINTFISFMLVQCKVPVPNNSWQWFGPYFPTTEIAAQFLETIDIIDVHCACRCMHVHAINSFANLRSIYRSQILSCQRCRFWTVDPGKFQTRNGAKVAMPVNNKQKSTNERSYDT